MSRDIALSLAGDVKVTAEIPGSNVAVVTRPSAVLDVGASDVM